MCYNNLYILNKFYNILEVQKKWRLNFIHQATIKGSVKTKTDKEKAILLQALSNIESFIENEKNRFECGQLWKQRGVKISKPLNIVYNKNNSAKLLFPIIVKKICLGKFEFNNYKVYTCLKLSPKDKSKHYIFNNIGLFSVNIITLLQEYINLCKKSHKKFNILDYFCVEPVPIENTFGANIDQHHIKFLVNKRCSLSELLRYTCRKGTKLREDTVLTININETVLKLHNKSAEENSDIFTINYIE